MVEVESRSGFIQSAKGEVMRDQEIIRLLLERDERGIDELMKQYGSLIRYIIRPVVPDSEDAKECLSDVTMRIWDKIGLYDKRKSGFSVWITAVARNTALNFAKGLRRNPDSGEIPQDTPSGGMTPEEEVIQRERQAKLEAAIRSLSGTDKILFYRRYYYMQSVKQISAETGMTLKSIESRLYRLKQRLKDEMGR